MIASLSFIALILFWLLINNQVGTEISVSLFGLVNLPIFYVSYELAVEQTRKTGLGNALPCGVINMLANFISLVVVILLTPVIEAQD